MFDHFGFLCRFVMPSEIGTDKPSEVRLRRRLDKDYSISYDVYDNPKRMRPEDWSVKHSFPSSLPLLLS